MSTIGQTQTFIGAFQLQKFNTRNQMLIVLGGLSGVGITAIAHEIVTRIPSAYLRIDTIEQAFKKVNAAQDVGPTGYVVAYELATSNLALGITVVADCVNPLSVTREAWRDVAARTSSALLEVEVVCSDLVEHRRRVQVRKADIPGHVTPTWEDVFHHEYEPRTTRRLILDSALVEANDATNSILEASRRLSSND